MRSTLLEKYLIIEDIIKELKADGLDKYINFNEGRIEIEELTEEEKEHTLAAKKIIYHYPLDIEALFKEGIFIKRVTQSRTGEIITGYAGVNPRKGGLLCEKGPDGIYTPNLRKIWENQIKEASSFFSAYVMMTNNWFPNPFKVDKGTGDLLIHMPEAQTINTLLDEKGVDPVRELKRRMVTKTGNEWDKAYHNYVMLHVKYPEYTLF